MNDNRKGNSAPTANMLRARRGARDALLARAVAELEEDDRVVAAWLAGSLGRGDADDLSDLDLWVIVLDEHGEAMNAGRRDYAARLGRPLLLQEAPGNAPPGGAYLRALYYGQMGPVEVDWYWQPQSQARIPHDARVLFNRVNRGAVPRAPAPSSATEQQRAEAAGNHTIFFWSMSPVAAKYIARRQSGAAFDMLRLLGRTLDHIQEAVAGKCAGGRRYAPRPLPPLAPPEQMAYLRALAGEVEGLLPRVAALGRQVPAEAPPSIYQFFNLVEAMLAEAERPSVAGSGTSPGEASARGCSTMA